MLYHVSRIPGITLLEPKVSTHGKAYVYAVDNKVTGLLFGAKQDDFDFMIHVNREGIPEIHECYPGALEIRYGNQGCSLYELDETGFLRGQTGWDAELVCESPVPVRQEIVVDDLYQRLNDEEKNNLLVIHRYADTSEYKAKISDHIVDRLIRFDALRYADTDERLQRYYGNIIAVLNELCSGKYL